MNVCTSGLHEIAEGEDPEDCPECYALNDWAPSVENGELGDQ